MCFYEFLFFGQFLHFWGTVGIFQDIKPDLPSFCSFFQTQPHARLCRKMAQATQTVIYTGQALRTVLCAFAQGPGQLPWQLPKAQFWGLAQCKYLLLWPVPWAAWSGMWLSFKKRAQGWQGRLEGLKNSHGPSKMRKLLKK